MTNRNIIMAVLALLILSSLNWDWGNIKSFVSGGVVTAWLVQNYYTA